MPIPLPTCNDQCNMYNFTCTPQFPIITLGKCVKWDTVKGSNGSYEAPEGSNVDTLNDFIIKKEGKILWCSECHGCTIICMESVCQLKDALKNYKKVLKGAKECDEECDKEVTEEGHHEGEGK